MAARRAAPHRPLSTGSKNARPAGDGALGHDRHHLPGLERLGREPQRLVRTARARSTRMPPIALASCPTTGASNTSFLPEEADRPTGPGDGERQAGGVEVGTVVGDEDGRSGGRDVVRAVDVPAGVGERSRAGEGQRDLLGLQAEDGQLRNARGHVEVQHRPAPGEGHEEQARIGVDGHRDGRRPTAAGCRRRCRSRRSCRPGRCRGWSAHSRTASSLPVGPHEGPDDGAVVGAVGVDAVAWWRPRRRSPGASAKGRTRS